MPANTIYVGRPTRWGNPYRGESRLAVQLYENDLIRMRRMEPDRFRDLVAPLKGKNLACWCAPGQPCHADVLLKMANEI